MIPVQIFLLILSEIFLPEFVGDYSGHTVNGNKIQFQCQDAVVLIEWCTRDIVKVSLFPDGNVQPDTSFVVIHEAWSPVSFTVEDTEDSIWVKSSGVHIGCQKRPFRISFCNSMEQLILRERPAGGLGWSENQRYAYFNQTGDEHFYGFGERTIDFDKKGHDFSSYNTAVFGYSGPLETMNINIPFFCSTKGYGLYFDNTYPGYFDMGSTDPGVYWCRADGGRMIYYFIYGGDLKGILERYTWLTGRQPLPPRWALGYLQSKYGYQTQTEAEAIVDSMRAKRFPCDAIILDLYWYKHMGDLWWDFENWPDPQQMISDFLDRGIKTVLIQEPYILEISRNYSVAYDLGIFGRDEGGTQMLLQDFWMGPAGLLDLTDPSAQSWWWALHIPLIDQGVSGWWTDLGEPELHPDNMVHYLGPSAKVHNIFNLLWSKTIFEGYENYYPEERLFNLTRSGFAGMQRYSTFPWSGDVASSFGGLEVQIPMLLGMGMSGVAYHNSDIGGFVGYTSPELYIRWMQYGTFCPVTRAHGVGQPQEPWAYGEEAERICRRYIQLRYMLLPYIYTYAYQNHTRGIPLARPLVMEYPDDPEVYNLASEYLFGDLLLVAPVTREGMTTKSVYLPQGEWVYYWSDSCYSGAQTAIVNAGLEILPLFVKKGAIIPMQPLMSYSDERVLDTLILNIYPSDSSSFTLYEDDGCTNDYQTGALALTEFSCRATEQLIEVNIGQSEGMYDGKPDSRNYISQIHYIVTKPDSTLKNGVSLSELADSSQFADATEGWWYDELDKLLFTKCNTEPNLEYQIQIYGNDLLPIDEGQDEFRILKLYQNYPNPFKNTTIIGFNIGGLSPTEVSLKVYNISGREVMDLSRYIKGGEGSVVIDGGDLASGIYFYQIRYREVIQTKKMICVR